MNNTKLVFASDHGGFQLKQELLGWATNQGFEVEDLGVNTNDMSSNYAKQGIKLARNVVKDNRKLGIGICGTGLGISFAVNRIKGIRGARITSKEDAQLAKQHNNANVLLFGGRQISLDQASKMIIKFLETTYEGGRHQERIASLDQSS